MLDLPSIANLSLLSPQAQFFTLRRAEGPFRSATMSLRDLVEGEAMLDDEENEGEVSENYDEDRRDGPSTERRYDDSSEEDEDEDDDEDAARAVSIACVSGLVTLGATDLWSTIIGSRRFHRRRR